MTVHDWVTYSNRTIKWVAQNMAVQCRRLLATTLASSYINMGGYKDDIGWQVFASWWSILYATKNQIGAYNEAPQFSSREIQ